jgi:hypothetical protein
MFVCLFVLADGRGIQIETVSPHKVGVPFIWDLASRPRTFLIFFNPLMVMRGYIKMGEEKQK